ncbi:YbcC family protein [Marinobacter confluentis]|uniref:Probable inorganic carbon transporter subunit DabA n=1 Tax=Marinobacter confluentis TaxID=1697557 RepID=A0A4Z1C7U5_9GAMM|nr:DUF2309 domain-containing protein [Marinobacter confluentis]TGN41710.1 DUF2309 domain-containing protein [Marinobacter confluentis]
MSSLSVSVPELQLTNEAWRDSCRKACDSIAPVWPLDQWIAVNPFWGLRHLPAARADQLLQDRGGINMLMPAAFYREAWEGGRIQQQDLEASMAERGEGGDPIDDIRRLEKAEHRKGVTQFAMLQGSLAEAACDQVSATCGAFFDQHQRRWSQGEENPNQEDLQTHSLFAFWLESVREDRSLDTKTGVPGARRFFRDLPNTLEQVTADSIRAISASGAELEAICHSLLLQVNGWASWCRGEDWRAGLDGQVSDRCMEILAIMLVWERLAIEFSSLDQKADWQKQRARARRADRHGEPDRLWVWQRAYELAYQRALWQACGLTGSGSASNQSGPATGPDGLPEVQAVFCIDVRSEVMRRHLEQVHPGMQTLGFAGFFGMPIEHHRHGSFAPVRRLPGLLPTSYRLVDTKGSVREDLAEHHSRDQKEITRASIREAKYSSLSTFTLVETTGMAWAWKLLKDTLKSGQKKVDGNQLEGRLVHRYGGDPLNDSERTGLAENLLKGMSLTSGFAPLLVFVGHGSHTDNNPNQAGLDCGACGGQSGGTNARVAAALVNDPQVRAGLARRGIRIPDYTWAVAAEHCTATDSVTIADREKVPDSHLQKLVDLEAGFEKAGRLVRRERATPLKLNGLTDARLEQAMETRTRDWSEVRPEWGLANNAAIIFAKRARTRGCNLGGRVFLHDYDPEPDTEGALLESLLSAPMVVANWINLQYFASVTAPEVYGAGNKLLHSVIGGNIGVVEGNDSRLRIGLPIQSVHDGTYWRHEPVRLTVLVDAPADRIESVIRRQPDVAALIDNHWVLLHRFAGAGVERYNCGSWEPVA